MIELHYSEKQNDELFKNIWSIIEMKIRMNYSDILNFKITVSVKREEGKIFVRENVELFITK